MSFPKAWFYSSIQELLASYGFRIDEDHGWFLKHTTDEQQIVIPFSEITGHTVASFLGKAERRGWQLTAESAAPAEPTLLPFI
jgi:hypothetical protein